MSVLEVDGKPTEINRLTVQQFFYEKKRRKDSAGSDDTASMIREGVT
jgi:hypothetical protein